MVVEGADLQLGRYHRASASAVAAVVVPQISSRLVSVAQSILTPWPSSMRSSLGGSPSTPPACVRRSRTFPRGHSLRRLVRLRCLVDHRARCPLDDSFPLRLMVCSKRSGLPLIYLYVVGRSASRHLCTAGSLPRVLPASVLEARSFVVQIHLARGLVTKRASGCCGRVYSLKPRIRPNPRDRCQSWGVVDPGDSQHRILARRAFTGTCGTPGTRFWAVFQLPA